MRVSVVIPVHNGEKYLAQAIESVLAQTYRDFELLIVDDGSMDRSAEIIRAYTERDLRVRCLSQKNRGVAAAGNRGLQEATNEWVARLDADDVFLPGKLERQVGFLRRNPDARIVGTLACFINQAGRPLGLVGTEGPFTRAEYDRLVRRNRPIYFVNSSTLMHRETVLAMGGYRDAFAPAEDVDLWIRMAESGHLMLKIPEPLLLYRMHGESLTMTQNARQRLLHRWAIACGRARVKGVPEPSCAEFLEHEKRRPVMERACVSRKETGERLYQRAALHYAEQSPLRMILFVLAAAVLHPRHVIPRLYARKILPLMNRNLRADVTGFAQPATGREVCPHAPGK
jgi:glycosyltransferase involved in cell wall biosynthesis